MRRRRTKDRNQHNRRSKKQFGVESLEPRIVLDGSGLQLSDAAEPHSTLAESEVHREVIFVNTDVPDFERLAADFARATNPFRHVVVLDAEQDGVSQIVSAMEQLENVDAIHIFSHGEAGAVSLGNDQLSLDNFSEVGADAWEAIQDSLHAQSDILIYGCDLASNEAGRGFVNLLATTTGADVAASDDLTGNTELGGDWELEYQTGRVTTDIIISSEGQAEWMGTLAGNPVPTVTPMLPDSEMINEGFTFDIVFDNTSTTSTDVGFAPYIDISAPDGLDISNASYLGAAVSFFNAGEFDGSGQLVDGGGSPVNHPLTNLPVTGGTPGETLYVAELPFGSFVPDQTPAAITFDAVANKANGAVVGTPLTITTTGGFALGCDPLDNPGTDAPISGLAAMDSVTPEVIDLIKQTLAPEDERSTGPNFPFDYTLTINIANGETVTALDIIDVLPNSFVYDTSPPTVDASNATSFNGLSITDEPIVGSPQNAPNNDFLIEFVDVTGSTAEDDIVITYTVWIDEQDADSADVLNANSGDDVLATNDAEVTGTYDASPVGDDDALTDESLSQQSISIQKGVAIVTNSGHPGATPGDVLEYTLSIQVSDFFEFSMVDIDDTFSDGQLFDSTFTPTYSINEGGTNTSGSFNPANFTLAHNSPGDGTTDVHFDLFNEVPDGVLTGDLFADSTQDGGTTVTVTFRTVIQEEFSDAFPSGDSSVDTGDVLTNNVTVEGTLPSGQTEADTSSAEIEIVGPAIAKAIYAIEGDTGRVGEDIVAGRTITYRLTFQMPTADYENLVITDFLPLPIYDATEVTTLSNTPTATAPAAGAATYGPLHDLHTLIPATNPPSLSTDGAANTVAFDFGEFDTDPSVGATIDLLFTVTAQDVLMADNLYLTNQVNAAFGSTNNGTVSSDAIVQNQVAAPELVLSKGIVSTTVAAASFSPSTVGPVAFAAPGSGGASFAGGINSTNLAANPIDSNLTDIDAGDLVKFAISIENSGGADGYNLLIQDSIPSDYITPTGGLNLEVRDGDGNALTFTGAAADLFTTGIRIDDPSAAVGSINNLDDATTSGDGSNIIIITYDLEMSVDVSPDTVYTNTADIAEYGAVDGGNDHTLGSTISDWTDDATTTTINVAATKSLVSTSEAHTSGSDVAIGEIVRYQLVAEIPEGTMNDFILDDNLPTNMVFLDDGTAMVAFVSDSGIVSNDISGTLNLAVGAGANVVGSAPVTPTFALTDGQVGASNSASTDVDTYNSGTDPRFKLGEIINDDDDTNSEYVVVEFNALVMNTSTSDDGDSLTNSFDIRVDGTNLDRSGNVTVDILEPSIADLDKVVSPTTGDAGDTVSYTVTFSNTGNTTAFDLDLTDTLPADLSLSLASVTVTPAGGTTGVTDNSSGNTVDIDISEMPVGGSVTIAYDSTLLVNVQPGETLQNTANLAYTGLPGANGTTSNPTGSSTPGASGSDNGERDGSGTQNDYADSDQASVTVDSPSISKTLISTSVVSTNNANDEAVIGETIQYEVTVTIPEGTTNSAEVVDTLDSGLSFVSLDAITTTAGVTSDNLAIDLNDESTIPTSFTSPQLTFGFGNLTNSNSNAAVESIVIRYTVLVDNVAGNQSATLLNNSAEFAWLENSTPMSSGPDAAANVTVLEPDLDVSKSVLPTSVDAGDSVTYTIGLAHSGISDTDAFDVTFSDPIPSGLTVSSFSVSHSVAGNITPLFELSGNTVQTISGSSFDMLVGETVTVTVSANTNSSIVAGGTLTNIASIEWTSLDGTDANERDGAGGVDDYANSGSADLDIDDPTITKNLINTSIVDTNNANDEAVIGETIQYEVTMSVPEGVLESAEIIDTLDSGLEFVSLDAIIPLSGGGATTAITTTVGTGDFTDLASFAPSVAGDDHTFDLGTITNSASGDGVAESLTLRYTVRVDNVAGNTTEADTMLNNSAVLQWEFDSTTESTAAANAAEVEVIEPLLQLSKVVDDDTPRIGQVVNYTLQLQHTGDSDADAQDVNFVDTLPAGMTLNLASINVTGATVDADSSTGNTIDLFFNTVALGTVIDIEYSATVSSDEVDIGVSLNNTAVVDWSSLAGSDVNERDNTDGEGGAVDDYEVSAAETGFLAQPVLNIAKEHVSFSANASNPDNFDLTIRVVAKNDGSLDLTDLSLIEDLAAHFGPMFVGITPPISVDTTGLTGAGVAPTLDPNFDANLTGGGDTNIFDGTSGLLEPGEFVSVTFVVELDPDAAGSTTPLNNQIAGSADYFDDGSTQSINDLSDDGSDPSTTNAGFPGDTGGMDDPNPLYIPDVSLAKSIVGTPSQLASGNYQVTYQLILENTGTTDLENLQITEDLLAEFGTAYIGVTTAPAITTAPAQTGSSSPTLATPAWDGNLASSGNSTIFDGTSGFLVPGDFLTVQLTVEVDPDASGTATALDNTANAEATPLDDGGNPLASGNITDDSDSGTNPNTTNTGEPGDTGTSDDPTPLSLAEVATTKVVTGVATNFDNFDVTFDIRLENIGSVDLTGIDLLDDLNTQMGARFLGVVSASLDTTTVTSGTPPTLNFGGSAGGTPFDGGLSGAGSENLLNDDGTMSPGDSLTVTLTITIDPDATGTSETITNQVTGAGDDPFGTEVTDLSDDGTDPNSDNPTADGDTGTGNTDDPSPVSLPDIGVTKAISGIPTELANGNFQINYRLVLENTGTETLNNLQIEEDLESHFGGGVFVGVLVSPSISVAPAQVGSSSPNLATWDGGLAGSAAIELFDGSSGVLVAGDFLQITFSIEVDPNAGGPGGTLENQVTAAGDDPNGTTVTDLSDSGTDPNTTNTGEDGDTGGSNDSTPLEIPNVGVAKAVVGSPVQSGTSQFEFDVTYRLVLENTGNVTLTGLDLVDDVTVAFGTTLLSIDTPPAIASHTVAVPANLPTLNAGWAADTSLSIFNDDGTIAPGETITVEYTLTMDSRPSGGATLFNQAAFTTDDPDTGVEAGPADLSDDGSDPDTLNTGSPGDLGTTDDPTPVVLPNASVGVAKNATWDDANDTATFVFTLEHYGSTAMLNMSMTENLDLILGAGNYVASTPVLVSGPVTIGVNTSFDGSADPELINPGSSLAVGETAVVQVNVSVTTIADPQSNGLGMFENQVTLTGEDSSGNTYTDDSVDGTDPDPDMDNDPTNDGSISNGNLTPDGTIGVAKDATVAPDVMSMTFDFYLEHFGNTEAFNISLTEDLDAVFGAGAYTVTGVSLISGPATISENGTFDGSVVQELVAPGGSMLPGETAQIQVALNLNMVFGQFSNQANIQGGDVDGNTYMDQSTSGTDPDPDMDDDPTNNNETTDFVVASGEINGTVYVDQNDNGTIDMGEVPIEGVTITLTGTDILGNPVSETTTTAADGTYEFTDLLPGDYTVTQTHPTEYYDGQETLGDGGGSAGSDSFMVTLNAANSFTANAYNFGELGLNPAAIGKSLLLVSGAGSGGLIPPLSGGEGATEPIVSVEGNRLTITSQSDYNEILVRAGTSFHRLRLENTGYDFDALEITEIVINASSTDFVTIEASQLDDRVVLRPGGGLVRSVGYSVEINQARNISVDGQGGNDRVFFVDSAQDDLFESTTIGSSMRDTSESYLNHAVRFELITGNSIVGGSDVANLVDTDGNDRLNATLGFATFSTPDREYRMNKFESVEIRQQNGGEDFIVLNDSPMPDTLTVRSGQTRFANEQYDVTTVGFNRVAAYSRKSTDDRATFFDSTGDDVFVAKADYARLSTETGRFEASQFAVTEAYALSGGNDRAELFDTPEDDQFVARDNYSLLSNSESTMRAVNFELVTGYANHGGDDVALLYGSDGDDRFVANGGFAEISRANRRVRSVGFERVLGESQGRGNDLAIFLGSTGQDIVTSQQSNVRLDSTNGSFNARQFSHVFALGGEAHDEIVFENLSDDAELRAAAMTVQLNASSRSIRAIDFGIVHANADEDATPMSVLDAIDFVFHQNGTWLTS